MTLVFVYGLLKRGFSLYNELKIREHCSFKGMASLPGATMYDEGDHPSVVLMGTGSVYGEVFDVPSPVLKQMDDIELKAGYERIQRSVVIEGKPTVLWMYIKLKAPAAPVIGMGRWAKQG